MNIEMLAKELKKNTEVLEKTLEHFNMKILQFNCRPSGFGMDCNYIFEIASIDGNKLKSDLELKVNLYNEEGEIIDLGEQFITRDSFSGYDTFCINFTYNGETLKNAKSAKVFATKI